VKKMLCSKREACRSDASQEKPFPRVSQNDGSKTERGVCRCFRTYNQPPPKRERAYMKPVQIPFIVTLNDVTGNW
jgi:hypothetical protein